MTTDVLRSGLRVGGQKDLQIIWDTLTVYGAKPSQDTAKPYGPRVPKIPNLKVETMMGMSVVQKATEGNKSNF